MKTDDALTVEIMRGTANAKSTSPKLHRQPRRIHRWGDRWSRVQRSHSVLHIAQALQIRPYSKPPARKGWGLRCVLTIASTPKKFSRAFGTHDPSLRAGSQPHPHYVRARKQLASSLCLAPARPHHTMHTDHLGGTPSTPQSFY